ncbi:MAG: DUF917 domain-containing protein [Oscillospiraceae bacterium]|nr:DUF917 domain-containing protein [Oscillospiraceae bacterium]
MTTLLEQDLVNVIYGATIFGGGGGGSVSAGIDLLKLYKKSHPEKIVQLDLVEPSQMSDNAYAAVTAGMGAPKALLGKDFTPYAVNSYEALADMAEKLGKDIRYTCPVEMGGFNTFVPMLISLLKEIPIVDADGAARAVPALDTLLLHVNGLNTSPLAMADQKNNRVTIELADPRDASEAEIIGRNICVAFDMISGLSGWMVTKPQIQTAIGNNTISRAMFVGELLDTYKRTNLYENVYEYIRKNSTIESRGVCMGIISKVKIETIHGFDVGTVIVAGDDGHEYKVIFQNENLVLFKDDKVIMTAPDIISFYDKSNYLPLTNADVAEGQRVDVGVLKVDQRWWLRGERAINEVWKPYFEKVGYSGDIVRY